MPDEAERRTLLVQVLQKGADGLKIQLSRADIDRIVKATPGYSASDLRALCQEAAMMPLRLVFNVVLNGRIDNH